MKFHDQPTIDYPIELADRGFLDCSYRNDLAGHAFNEARKMSVWVREQNKDDREDPSVARFSVAVNDEDGYPIQWVYDTESLEDLLRFLDRDLVKRGGGQ